MFENENKHSAEMYINRHLSEIKEKLERDGYFMYDEYEIIYINVGRLLPDILNKKLHLSDDDALCTVEEMVEGEGNCGIIVKNSLLNDRERITKLLNEFYKT